MGRGGMFGATAAGLLKHAAIETCVMSLRWTGQTSSLPFRQITGSRLAQLEAKTGRENLTVCVCVQEVGHGKLISDPFRTHFCDAS